jgi:membrane fusion protein, heavy metal efflux system
MKRGLTVIAILAIAVAFGSVVSRVSPMARTVFSWTALLRPEKPVSISVEPTVAKDTSAPSEPKSESGKPPEGSIAMRPNIIEAQGIEVAPAESGTLAQVLTVPGTISLDPGRVARVPGRVEGTVTQMRKQLGDLVNPGEVVAVLDSREVADAKSEYLTAQVALELQKTLSERQQMLWAQKSNAEIQ